MYLAETQLSSSEGPFDVCSLHNHPNVQAVLARGLWPSAFSSAGEPFVCSAIGDLETLAVMRLPYRGRLNRLKMLKHYHRGHAWQEHPAPVSHSNVYPKLRVTVGDVFASHRRRR